MTLSLQDGRYVSQIYFACGDGADLDILGFLYRDQGEPFHLTIRFRYYASPDPWDKRDLKNWHDLVFESDNEEDAMQSASKIFRTIAEGAAGRVTAEPLDLHVVPVRSDRGEVQQRCLMSQPWVHTKREPG